MLISIDLRKYKIYYYIRTDIRRKERMEKVQKKKMGRPLTANSTRDKTLTIRVNDEQRNALKELAEKKGLTVSELILKTFNLIK